MTDHYDALETRKSDDREADLFARLPGVLRTAMEAPAYAERLRGIDPATVTSRAALADLPVLRKSDLPALPKFVHMGANHPYPNAPKAAGEAIAKELGFEVLPPLVFALSPGDYSAQCLSLKSAGANYAYLGNTAASNISVMKACKTAGVDVQFLSNVWGMDENAAKAAGDAADGVVFPLRTAVGWGGNAPGMKTVMEISKMSDPTGKVYRPVHYIAAVCTALYMKEAIEWAAKNGGVNGPNVKNGFYQKKDWVPAGMEGVCNPSTWTDKDHRPTMKVDLYRAKVSGSTEGDLNDLMAKGTIKLEKVKTIDLPRKAEWLGW